MKVRDYLVVQKNCKQKKTAEAATETYFKALIAVFASF